jgi:SNF2 family DNA or RNA helicase
MIVERLKAEGHKVEWLYGGTKDRAGLMKRFMTDAKTRVLVMNTVAGGTGTDGLQKVAHYIDFYETPTSPTIRKQAEKRAHREGQEHRVFIIDQIMDKSLDAGILANIAEGIDCHERVVNGKLPSKKFFLTAAHEK